MSYGLKYYSEFVNYYEETIRIEIRAKSLEDDTGATEINLGGTPLLISYPGDDNYLFNPIIGSEAVIQLFSDTNFKFISLHNSDSRAHRVDIFKDSSLIWQGWILPDLFSEPYIAPPYIVTITARCGLGELKEKQVTDLNLTGSQTLLTIFKTCLLSIETATVMNEAVNIYYDSVDTVNDSPIELTKINIDIYNEMNCYEMLTDILLSFGARLYLLNAEWNLIRAKEVSTNVTIRKWDLTDEFCIPYEDEIKTFLISRPAGNQIVNESPQLDVLPAWKKLVWLQDLGKLESFVKNSEFTEWNSDYTDRRGDGAITGSSEIIRIKHWTEGTDGLLRKKQDSDGNVYAQWTQGLTYNNPNYSNYITQLFYPVQINALQKISIKFEVDLLTSDIDITESGFVFEVRVTGNRYLKVNGSTGLLEWTNTPTKITVSDIETTYQTARNNDRVIPENWKTIDLIAPGIDAFGQLEILIYGSIATFLRIRKSEIKLLDINEFEYQEELKTTVTINENNIYTPETIEVKAGDLPDEINGGLIWENGYRKNDGYPTKEWHERNGAALPLLQLIGKDYATIYKTPQFKLTVPILSQTIQFDSCIVDYLVLPKKYICASAEIDMQTCIFRGSFMEFGVWEGALWILEDGTWNDEGIWIDSETWNDDDSAIQISFSGGVQWYDLSSILSVTDTILTIPTYGIPGMGGLLRNGATQIEPSLLPFVLTNATTEFLPNIFAQFPLITSFSAIVGGVQKVIRINVTL